jgi:hypothetical protein
MSYSDYHTALQLLDYEFGGLLNGPMWTKEEAIEEIRLEKASGPPHCWNFGPKKGDVLNHRSMDDFIDEVLNYMQYSNVTLKDELRILGKDARLFIPAPVAMVAVGNFLFGAQNERLAARHNTGSVKIGLKTPGREAYDLWRIFCKEKGDPHQFDGKAQDANWWMGMVCVIRDLRLRYLPSRWHKLAKVYYDMTYHMLGNVDGALLVFCGQQTGQTNTASDNSMGTKMLVGMHGIWSGLEIPELKDVYTMVVGDDIALRDPTGLFTPSRMTLSWQRAGMYLESPAEHEELMDIKFCGMTPVFRKVFGKEYLLYHYDPVKMRESMNVVRRSNSPEQRLRKLISVATLVFPLKEEYEKMVTIIRQYAHDNRDSLSLDCLSGLGDLSDLAQLNLFCGFEPYLP